MEIINCHTDPRYKFKGYKFRWEKHIALVDRGTRWGNPFIVGEDGDRKKVVALYRRYAIWRLEEQPDWLDSLLDKTALACWCAPNVCHAEVLADLIEERKRFLAEQERRINTVKKEDQCLRQK